MNATSVAVLLVGSGARRSRKLQDHLKRRGCDISFASSCGEALQVLRERHFDLVLSEFRLADGTAYELMPSLRGTDATMFFSKRVEAGCWWMSAIHEGRDCCDQPGMRPAQFTMRLDKILAYKASGKADGTGPGPAADTHAEAELQKNLP